MFARPPLSGSTRIFALRAQRTASPLTDFLTLRDVAQKLGASYFAAYSMAASGLLGEPLIVGRTHFYPRGTAEAAIERRRAERATQHQRKTVEGVA